MKHRILIVEDNILLAGQQKKWFEKSGYEAVTTIDEPGARRLLKKEPFDLVLSDVRLPQGDGISLLEWMQRERIDVPFIIMTGYASVSDAVRAIKMGAKDYLAKPVQMDELQSLIKNILHPRSVIYGKDKGILPRNSRQMKEVENLARTVAPFDISVLILGPNGAGKESVAQRIHYSSERREKPFLAVNCGVIPKELAPSLFFGHVKGTFTGADTNREGFFETARGGTLFLDEVGTLSMEVQSMLLRTLQEGSYIPIGSNREKHSDVRIVAATRTFSWPSGRDASGKTSTTVWGNLKSSCRPCMNARRTYFRLPNISGKSSPGNSNGRPTDSAVRQSNSCSHTAGREMYGNCRTRSNEPSCCPNSR